jgi:hypothetical protein
MQVYKSKLSVLSGTDFHEVHKKAFSLYQEIKRKSKRRPYVRSIYFKKNKIFLGIFWQHLYQKHYTEQVRRMKFFFCALDLIRFTRYDPESKENPNKRDEILHRFAGVTRNKEHFFVQIKENKRTGEKFLISAFPSGK